ncbi:hypothetical protein [Cohnella zeiphila]|uniref:WD40 repeat domain-containing protein n=1 Tax=Cohnella zeiphila TaxID=2761120 RepID=A0A7X0SJ10_9BACL|nr:hypothetical protein [Cohnella zeiphila]MBB6730873.1 hypothetical protein [Cohnella zeiphila]
MKPGLLAAIPEQHTRFVQLPNEMGHNSVWDFVQSPDGRFYLSLCGENDLSLTAFLYEYDPKTQELRMIANLEETWIRDPEQMPHSKIHTSIDFLPDGRLIMATHNTAPAPAHKQWMFEQNYEHPWEGFPGSVLMIVDPNTKQVENRGVPLPRESIYGGLLGNDPRYYYFLGYMRGHFYRIDLETNEVRDYGKVSEFSSCRLVKDRKGRIYSGSYTGGMWRYDPETDELESLDFRFTSPHGTQGRRQFIFALHSPRNTLLLVANVDGEIIEFNPETSEAVSHGPIHLPDDVPAQSYLIGGLAADRNFVLYYGLKTFDEYCPVRLVRWDILNGGKPENLGIVSPNGKDSQYICEMVFDDDGWLHMVDVCGEFSPYILSVDVARLEAMTDDAKPAPIRPYIGPDLEGVGEAAYMHILAEKTCVLPLHQHLPWRDTAVRHVFMKKGRLYSISGKQKVVLAEADGHSSEPEGISTLHHHGGPLSCLELNDQITAILTSDQVILLYDPDKRTCDHRVLLPESIRLVRLHAAMPSGDGEMERTLIASDGTGMLYACEVITGRVRKLDYVRLADPNAQLVPLDDRRLLLSGRDDEILVYDYVTHQGERLAVRSASIRGRAYRATITGGVVLEDVGIVLGTQDGMLMTLDGTLSQRRVYGRLYASGGLHGFIPFRSGSIAGIYGGPRDAGHVFVFSRDTGFIDLGRPRVVKITPDLARQDTEWANIHEISCLAYDEQHDVLCVASGETYGAIVRYQNTITAG